MGPTLRDTVPVAYGWVERGDRCAVPDGVRIVAAEIDITMLDEAPQPILFAALQTNFDTPDGVQYGANHIGLQWNSISPSGRAVNFGGYVGEAGVKAGVAHEISGQYRLETGWYLSPDVFPRMPNDDRRTARYDWAVGVPVRCRVEHQGGGTWRAFFDGVPYRDSHYPGTDRIGAMVFWTEYGTAPCRCRFSQFTVEGHDGRRYEIGLVFEPPIDDVVVPHRAVVTMPTTGGSGGWNA